MSSRLGRLAGALLLESEGRWFLIGDRKQPCDFAAAGFADPGERDGVAHPFVELGVSGAPALAPPVLELDGAGEPLAEALADRLLVRRNGSVSERLWQLILAEAPRSGAPIDARWLVSMPRPIWEIVREAVLKCT